MQNMNTNWAKILLFTLIGFALGWLVCRTCCGSCGRGDECKGDRCAKEMSCHGMGEGHACPHAGGKSCAHGEGKGACCKGGGSGMNEGDPADAIVAGLKEAGFQGDTVVAIDGGRVKVHRSGDSTRVRVEMKETEHMH